MATAKQIAANRSNSKKPHTAAAKAASRFNALKHGIYSQHQIMFDETPEDLADLAAEYHEQHAPANATERELVDTLIHNEWRLRRMRRVEAVLWEHAANAYLTAHPDEERCNSADAFVTNSNQFERLQRIVNACERNYHRALKELKVARAHSLRSSQPETEPAPKPDLAESKPTSPDIGPFRQNPDQAPPPLPAAAQNAARIPTIAEIHAAGAAEMFRVHRESLEAAALQAQSAKK